MTLPKADAESVGFDPHRLKHLSRWLSDQVACHRLAGASVLVARQGSIAFFDAAGHGRVAQGSVGAESFTRDTLVRLYSMTKPITTVAAMMLHEQGCFQLDDPVALYLPAFADTPVWDGTVSSDALLRHVSAQQSLMTIRQLMTHTAGLTYGFMNATPVDQYYREQELTFPGSDETLATLVDRLAEAPLLCQPGSQWNYSVATDVLGRLVELWSGQSLDEYFRDHIFLPLQMHDTGFHVSIDKAPRLADLMGPPQGGELSGVAGSLASDAHGVDAHLAALISRRSGLASKAEAASKRLAPIVLDTAAASPFLHKPALCSGGGGLTGSIDDFARFCQMLLNQGQLDGQRLLSRKSVEFMCRNQLPGNCDMAAMGQAVWSETSYQGIGFGLGFAVVLDPVAAQMISSIGEVHWGGAASTFFWIDPLEDLFVVFLTQLYPSSTYPLRRELRTAVYQALR